MRKLIALSCLMLVAYGQPALSADAAGKPIVVAAVTVQHAAAAPSAAREASLPVGVLESFGAIGFAP